jgi:O-antigen/teichoic acid export membrane protein
VTARGSNALGGQVAIRVAADSLSILRGIVFIPLIMTEYGAADYGRWAQISAVSLAVSQVAGLRLEAAIIRFVSGREDEPTSRAVLANVLGVVITISSLIALLVWGNADRVTRYVFGGQFGQTTVLVLAGMLPARSITNYLVFVFRSLGLINRYSYAEVAKYLAQLLLLGYVALAHRDFMEFLVGLLVIEIATISVLFAVLPRQSFLLRRVPSDVACQYLRFSLPLLPNGLLMSLVSTLDKIVLSSLIDLRTVGLYASASQVASFVGFSSQPIAFVLLPKVAGLWNAGKHKAAQAFLEHAHSLYQTVAVLVAIVCISEFNFGMSRFLRVPETFDYLTIVSLVVGALAAGFTRISVFQLHLKNRTARLVFLYAAGALASILVLTLAVPRLEMGGAALAYAIGQTVTLVLVLRSSHEIGIVAGALEPLGRALWRGRWEISIVFVCALALPPMVVLGVGALGIARVGWVWSSRSASLVAA